MYETLGHPLIVSDADGMERVARVLSDACALDIVGMLGQQLFKELRICME